MIEQVCEFNKEMLGVVRKELCPWPQHEYDFLLKALHEEIDEMKVAYAEQDIIGIVDSLLDLCYFAIGGGYRAGVTPEQIRACFNVIHHANMNKKKGVNAKRDTGAEDAVKPADWVPPEKAMASILLQL